jgi:hypothetical protein
MPLLESLNCMLHLQRMIFPKRLTFMLAGLFICCGAVYAVEETPVARGERFLAGLFNAELGLLPEFRGSKSYWLFHDNYLAAKVLSASHPDLSEKIRGTLKRHGVTNSGKIEIIFGEATRPLPFRHYQLTNLYVTNGLTIRTEVVTPKVLTDWDGYADLLLLAAIAQSKDNPGEARRNFDRASALWDGKGLVDRVVAKNHRYATYKLALFLIAAQRLQLTPPHASEMRTRLLALQNQEGGWITDYDAALKPLGFANVETTCLAMLALREDKRRTD